MTKPKIKVDADGESGNIFAIIGSMLAALRRSGTDVSIGKEATVRVTNAQSYEEATGIVEQYVDIEWE